MCRALVGGGSPWPWLAGVVALAAWAPNLIRQAANGFPQLAPAGAIAGGSSISSQPGHLFVPYQLVLVSPVLVPAAATCAAPTTRGWRTSSARSD